MPTREGRRRGASFWVTVIAVIVAALFVFQNTQKVEVKFVFSTTTTPLIFALLFAALLGFIIGLAAPRFRRRD